MDKYKITGKLKRELDEIERKYQASQKKGRKKTKTIKLKDVIQKLKKEFGDDLLVDEGKGYHYIKKGKSLICWLAQRKYGVSISYKTEDDRVTHRITDKDDLEKYVKTMREEKCL